MGYKNMVELEIIRISVGIENVDDLDQALATIEK